MEIAQDYVENREGFGINSPTASVQIKLGHIAHQIQIRRQLPCMRHGSSTRATAPARKCPWPRFMSPTPCTTQPMWRSYSNGARGFSRNTILEWIYRAARSARLVDGATEVHMMVLARFMRGGGPGLLQWGRPARPSDSGRFATSARPTGPAVFGRPEDRLHVRTQKSGSVTIGLKPQRTPLSCETILDRRCWIDLLGRG